MEAAQATVTTTASQIAVAPAGGAQISIVNRTASAPVYIGGDDTVTTTTGFVLKTDELQIDVTLAPDEEVWAVAESTTATVHVLLSGLPV